MRGPEWVPEPSWKFYKKDKYDGKVRKKKAKKFRVVVFEVLRKIVQSLLARHYRTSN
jgi:hypothetical protein